jgi:hypothetical protein
VTVEGCDPTTGQKPVEITVYRDCSEGRLEPRSLEGSPRLAAIVTEQLEIRVSCEQCWRPANPTRRPLLLVYATSHKRGAMGDRDVRSQRQKLTHEEHDDIGSANLDPGRRPGEFERDRSEQERIRGFIRELYEELLSLAVAARSILHWPLPSANQIALENPIKRRNPNYRRRTTSEEEAQTGLDKTLADSIASSDPPSTIPDPAEPGVQPKAPDARQLRPNGKKDVQ